MDKLHIRLKQCREERHLSQYEVSDILEIKQPTWNKYETGKSGMSAETLYHICKTLNVSADWLLGLLEINSKDTLMHFYDKIIDLICKYGEDNVIKDETVDVMIEDVNQIIACLTE